jgi:16S rRNA (uracil1498-N3)-methyltransferase
MARRRFFVPQVHRGEAALTGEEARHLTQVLRVEAGQRFEISDDQNVYLAEVSLARKAEVRFRVLEKLPSQSRPRTLTLYAALIKFDRFELLLEKATELGVDAIVPLRTARSEKGLEKAAEKRLARWQRIVLESSQQSRRDHLPKIALPLRFSDALRQAHQTRLFLDEQPGGRSLLETALASDVALFTGPEGGWEDAEREQALAAGLISVSLGPLILRAETAALAALALIQAVPSPPPESTTDRAAD